MSLTKIAATNRRLRFGPVPWSFGALTSQGLAVGDPMKYQPALFRLAHWTELIKPLGYFLMLTLGLAFFPIPFWAGLLVGLLRL